MFKNRVEAGELLVDAISNHDLSNAFVLAIPRGGVVVAYEIAKALHLPLRLIYIKKVGHPDNPEYSIGAIGQEGKELDLDSDYLENEVVQQIRSAQLKMRKQIEVYGHSYTDSNLKNQIVLLVDDGAATGNSILYGIQELKRLPVKKIIVLLPVCPLDTYKKLLKVADELICLEVPLNFNAVGQFYENFDQVDDQTIKRLLTGVGFSDKKKG
jgi:predicted phosphoribosyltransferase